jgi:hypothetical protein
MSASARWRSPWIYAAGGLALAGAALAVGMRLSQPGAAPTPPTLETAAVRPAARAARPAAPAASASEADAVEGVVQAQRKRIMGRLRSLEMVRRVATTVRPLVDRALEQPAVQADLRALALSSGMSVSDYKRYFAGKQEADLLLESGGDPNARSVADAIGVAQYLAGTGARCGLHVDLGASNALSRQIYGVEAQMTWLEAQPEGWSRPAPAALVAATARPKKAVAAKKASAVVKKPVAKAPAPVVPSTPASAAAASVPTEGTPAPAAPVPQGASPASVVPASPASAASPAAEPTAPPVPEAKPAPAAPGGSWSRDRWLAYRKQQWQNLVAKRRRVDERYDPAKAVTVQTRYLVGLTRRFGGVDWALQAYHGGEAGAMKTMALFARSGSAQLGSRGGSLSYADLYRRMSPSGTPEAFSYLFGRSDDHRYYWWKVLMAERALDLYRKDPKEFEKQWKALQPGICADAAYYPAPSALQFADNGALREAYHDGTLVRLPGNAYARGIQTENLAALAPDNAELHKGLRPEAMGALLRLAELYRGFGGRSPLTVTSMVQSNAYRGLWNARYPQPPLPPDVPKDPEFHTTGLTFDLQRPASDWDRKVLEYALGRLYDTLRVSWRLERDAASRRYHVVVNPAYKAELAQMARKGGAG